MLWNYISKVCRGKTLALPRGLVVKMTFFLLCWMLQNHISKVSFLLFFKVKNEMSKGFFSFVLDVTKLNFKGFFLYVKKWNVKRFVEKEECFDQRGIERIICAPSCTPDKSFLFSSDDDDSLNVTWRWNVSDDLLITVQFSTGSGLTVTSVFRGDPPKKDIAWVIFRNIGKSFKAKTQNQNDSTLHNICI